MSQLHWLDTHEIWFPPTASALKDPDGLLAVGGDLTPPRLIQAYSRGIFPWYSEGQPLLWWTPDPRMVLLPENIHFGRSLKKLLRKQMFRITIDQAFETVMRQCGTIDRKEQDGSWITEEMIEAYVELNKMGVAHSVEAWLGDDLVGGLYGVALGSAYFGESMYSLVSGASKAAFSTLAQQLKRWQFELIDCQIESPYLASFGATEVSRDQFEETLARAIEKPPFAPKGMNSALRRINGSRSPFILEWQQAWEMPETGFNGIDATIDGDTISG
ncbi:leucyl/phenylalanyl-tRNA--protein transferase [Teredinibacter purpureus]|uniref:leucyl/phenylalanyl-tRNA--protein transferase n=1 Tax=Teredinibacter purpureus TaxID=2731756 RepID=UPI0009E64DBA|nr:leucyl/phenylalanyl-tRNA--protein transferase [Teredinibacter purpureus]